MPTVRLRNISGAPMKWPTLGIVQEAGEEADIALGEGQPTPDGFEVVTGRKGNPTKAAVSKDTATPTE